MRTSKFGKHHRHKAFAREVKGYAPSKKIGKKGPKPRVKIGAVGAFSKAFLSFHKSPDYC